MNRLNNESYEQDWKRFGDVDPYYGVLTHERFRDRNLTPEARREFFHSGEEHVCRTLKQIRLHVDQNFTPQRTLDFGCGVGRLLIPFAKISSRVTGVDISEGMLREATANCESVGVSNVSLAGSIHNVPGSFDFVHSYIVFQHIPPAVGIRLFESVLAKVANNGVIALHLTYGNEKSNLQRFAAIMRGRSRFVNGILNLRKKKSFSEPFMQMNEYSLNNVMLMLEASGFQDLHLFFTRHAISSGLMLIGQKGNHDYEF